VASPDTPFTPPLYSKGYWHRVGKRLKEDKITLFVLGLLTTLIILAVLAPLFTPYDPYTGSVMLRLKSIGTPGHWLGTDEVGRDLWTRMIYGGRLSLLAGILPVFLALVIGGFLGMLAGFVGGLLNSLIMRVTDILYAFPSILLAIAITGLLGSGIVNTIIALTVSFIPPIIRMSESITAQIRHLDFVDAARASGASSLAIIRYHVLNNILGPILVYTTSLISLSIILAAGLSFLGLGVTPPNAEWGLMLNNMRQAIWTAPLVAALPGVMIFLTSMSFNLLSDGLRQAMDVRL